MFLAGFTTGLAVAAAVLGMEGAFITAVLATVMFFSSSDE
jgi:hypothetical protein